MFGGTSEPDRGIRSLILVEIQLPQQMLCRHQSFSGSVLQVLPGRCPIQRKTIGSCVVASPQIEEGYRISQLCRLAIIIDSLANVLGDPLPCFVEISKVEQGWRILILRRLRVGI